MQTITPSSLAAELVAAAPPLSEREQHLAICLYRLLAGGEPVEAALLADRAELAQDEVDRALAEWPGIFTDERDRVIGFLGLSIRPMPHRLSVGGRTLYAWCAYDTLFLPELLGARAEVQSHCPTTGAPITLTVVGTEVREVHPPQTLLSYLHKDEPLDENVIKTFCHYIHFFANANAAAEWTAKHEDTFTISLAEGSEIARLTNCGRYPSVFADRGSDTPTNIAG
jgi:alkylmercury lyase